MAKLSNLSKKKCENIVSSFGLTFEQFSKQVDFSDEFKGQVIFQLVERGIKIEAILDLLDWKGFEFIVSSVFDKMGYTVQQNFRFKDEFTKYEVDVLAFQYPYLFLIDCKHYKTPNKSNMKDAADKQKERTEVLLEMFPILFDELMSNLHLPIKRKIHLYPMIISWRNHEIQFHQNIPVVAFSQLSGFIQEIDEIRFNLFHLTLELD
jgi:hypothetical protein